MFSAAAGEVEIDGDTEELEEDGPVDGGDVNDPDAADESCLPVALVAERGDRGATRRRDAGFGLMPAPCAFPLGWTGLD